MRPLVRSTINSRHWNANRTYLQLLSCTEMPAPPSSRALLLGGGPDPPSSRALLLGGGSAMTLDVQRGYRAVCGRSFTRGKIEVRGPPQWVKYEVVTRHTQNPCKENPHK